MHSYQGLAKKYRPQKFSEIIGQNPIVQTLKNALRLNKIGHAYLFCGTRGTGKTTLARLFAKAANCSQRSENEEPCNICPSCKEIMAGCSLDVIEIDGASNRGIDDIRNLNETVCYASSLGKYKIYIIDEVHMLTKEAFNALLKTLEEPPEHVIFFFATTEPHKVLSTIMSRCQRFNLKRILPEQIISKLKQILKDLGLSAEDEALKLVAAYAEGSLRDAESLFDRLLCFQDGVISVQSISEALGLVSRDLFYKLDKAALEEDFLFAFELSETIFKEGCHLEYFLESLAGHYRQILLTKLGKDLSEFLTLEEKKRYAEAAKCYTGEQCLDILSQLKLQLEQIQKSPFKRIDLEILLLQILRSMKKMPLESLVDRLVELKRSIASQKEGKPILAETSDLTPVPSEPKALPLPSVPTETIDEAVQKKIHHERVMQFATVELKGSLKKN